MNKKQSLLNDIQEILEQEKMDCSLHPATEELPIERLLVFLGNDWKKREQILEITAQQQPNRLDEKTSSLQDSYYRVQFYFIFPFKIKEMALSQVSSLILFLNQSLEFPGLELNELDNRLAYRYVWLAKTSGIDSQLIMNLIGMILLTTELVTQSIERVADGTSSFNDLLQEIINLNQNNS